MPNVLSANVEKGEKQLTYLICLRSGFLALHCLCFSDLLLVSSPSSCLRVPLVLVLTEDGGPGGYPAVMLLLLFADLGGRIRLLCCSCLLLLKVAEELQLVMIAPLLVLAPNEEKKTQPLLAIGKRYRRMG